jgi:hypothetical protein
MRACLRHEVTYVELDQPELMMHWGGLKRRKRLRPTHLLVKWDRDEPETEWTLRHVYLMGNHVFKGSTLSMGKTLFENNRLHPDHWDDETPDWVYELVDQSHPVPEWQRISKMMGIS